MTILGARPIEGEEADLLSLISDSWTPLGKPFADAFRAACEAEASIHGGLVDPNNVRARLLDHPDYEPRRYSASWSTACGRGGFLDMTDQLVPIEGKGSRGNGGKSVYKRRLRTK